MLAADPRPEQLCWMSSFQQGEMVFDPWFLGFDHGIEIGEKSANGRDEGDLLRFAQRTQVPVKLADHRVVPSEGYYLDGNRWRHRDRWARPACGRAKGGGGDCRRQCEVGQAPEGQNCLCGGPRDAEDRGGRVPGGAPPPPRGACRRPRPARWQSPAPASGGPRGPRVPTVCHARYSSPWLEGS